MKSEPTLKSTHYATILIDSLCFYDTLVEANLMDYSFVFLCSTSATSKFMVMRLVKNSTN